MANSLSEARALAVEGFLRAIVEYDIQNGPAQAEHYLQDDSFLPVEPKWLRTRVTDQLSSRLKGAWNEE